MENFLRFVIRSNIDLMEQPIQGFKDSFNLTDGDIGRLSQWVHSNDNDLSECKYRFVTIEE